MTALGKTADEVDEMAFCEVNALLKFWRKNPPAHILLGILAEQKIWRRPADYSEMMPADVMALVGRNRAPINKLPADVSAMFADIRAGKIPGLKPIEH